MLVFDVKVNNEAREYAEHNQIKIFEANIIYHLFDSFMAHVKNVQEERKKIEGKEAIFPCIFKVKYSKITYFNSQFYSLTRRIL
jgi:translation initiation factor 5B